MGHPVNVIAVVILVAIVAVVAIGFAFLEHQEKGKDK
jgi:hypothetical protein